MSNNLTNMLTVADVNRRTNVDQQSYCGRRHALASVSVVDLSADVQFAPNFVIGRLDDHVGTRINNQSRRHYRNKHQRTTRRHEHTNNQLLMLQGSRSQYAIDQAALRHQYGAPDDDKTPSYVRMTFQQQSGHCKNGPANTADDDVIVDNNADASERLAPTLKYSRMLPLINNRHRSRRHMSYHDNATTHRSVTWPADTFPTPRSPDVDGDHVTNALDCDSLTLPRIEEVLKSEGVESLRISEQINKLKHKIDRLSNYYPALKVQSRDHRLKHTDEAGKIVSRLKPIDSNAAHSHRASTTTTVNSTTNKILPASTESNLLDLALKREEMTLNTYRDEIERTRWLTSQHVEIVTLGPDFVSPRIILMSSNFPECETLRKFVHKSSDMITIIYNFETATYESIQELISIELNAYKVSAKARSLLLLCRGGADHLFMIKKRVLTVQKLHKDKELISFWKQLSESISRIKPEDAVVSILNSLTPNIEMKDKKRSQNLSLELERITHPNNVRFSLLDISCEEDKQQVRLYFDLPGYERHVMLMLESEEDGEIDGNTMTSNQAGTLLNSPVSPKTLDDDIIEQVYQCNLPTSEEIVN